MYERCTDQAREVLQRANQEAQRLNHEYIGTQHILLGLVQKDSGVAADVLKNLGADLPAIRREVARTVPWGPDMVTMGKLSRTPRAKKVIEYSTEEARNLYSDCIGTEHLLLGLLREQEGIAAQILMSLGLKLEDVREEVLKLAKTGPGESRRRAQLAVPAWVQAEKVGSREPFYYMPVGAMADLTERIALAGSLDMMVLLTGEIGTGKAHLARLIHQLSPRAAEPFLVIPCGAVPANLIESELFGHVRGAFPGADHPNVGKFEAAGKGTLLLEEIDALSLETQAALLRVLETGEFEPVGSNATRSFTARLIVASTWDLDHEVERGRFRQDLYDRLNIMSFHLPPLRECRSIIPHLAAHFVTDFARCNNRPVHGITAPALRTLQEWWGGGRATAASCAT